MTASVAQRKMSFAMGPTLILDKSALQALSRREVWRLSKHFSLNVPPILVAEILGDLAKTDANEREHVVHLARKLPAIDRYENEHYLSLCMAELAGMLIEMRGLPMLGGAIPVTTKTGERGIFFDSTPEQIALMRWSEGNFSESDKLFAASWRGMIPQIDLEAYKDTLNRFYIIIPRAEDFREIAASVDTLLTDQTLHEPLLNFFLDECGVSGSVKALILFRWRLMGRPHLRTYVPYVSHCIRVLLVFIGGIRNRRISTRATNKLDLEYCYYLPFCMGFVSRDHLHKDLCSALLGREQDFIDGDELKIELGRLADEWDAMSSEQREEREAEYGDYPPERADSLASELWRKHMKPWHPGSGNRAVKMSKDEEARLLARIDELYEAVEQTRATKRS